MILINRNDLISQLDALDIDVDIKEEVLDIIEDMPYFDCLKTKSGDLTARYYD